MGVFEIALLIVKILLALLIVWAGIRILIGLWEERLLVAILLGIPITIVLLIYYPLFIGALVGAGFFIALFFPKGRAFLMDPPKRF